VQDDAIISEVLAWPLWRKCWKKIPLIKIVDFTSIISYITSPEIDDRNFVRKQKQN
jgi:hypothetical protein